MTARRDLLGLLSLQTAPRARRLARVRAVLDAHKNEIAAACAAFVAPPLDGDDAAAAWRWVKAFTAQTRAASERVRRDLGLEVYWLVDYWLVAVVDGSRHLDLLTAGGDAFFGRLLRRPDLRRARALLSVPHDVAGAGWTPFFYARPPRSAPSARLIEWLFHERFGPHKDAVRAELDVLAVAAVDAVSALDAAGATPLARWQRLSASLKAAGLGLRLEVKTRTIGIDAEVWIGSPRQSVWSAAVAAAVERLFVRSSLSAAAIAALYEEVAARARPTRSLWIERRFHLVRNPTWTCTRPPGAATKKKPTSKKKTATAKKTATKKTAAKKTAAKKKTKAAAKKAAAKKTAAKKKKKTARSA